MGGSPPGWGPVGRVRGLRGGWGPEEAELESRVRAGPRQEADPAGKAVVAKGSRMEAASTRGRAGKEGSGDRGAGAEVVWDSGSLVPRSCPWPGVS